MKFIFFILMTFSCCSLLADINPQYIETLELSVGHNHVCVNTPMGVKCFGNSEKITTVPPNNLVAPTSLQAANRFSCAIVMDGIRCWGEIPNIKKTTHHIPLKTLPNPKHLSLGYEHACAVSETDQVLCWGSNEFGESTPPVELKNITELSAGMNNTCAIADGKVVCWGINITGSLEIPENLLNPKNLTSGWWHHCVNTDEGIKCWGSPYKEFTAPKDPEIKEFTSGGFFNCAIVPTGVKCWDEKGIANLVEGSLGATQLSVGSSIACADTQETGVICWKLSNKGIYKKMISYVPSGGINNIENVAAGPGSTCLFGDEGKLKCWGANFDNAIDVPSTFTGPISSLVTGAQRTCAIKDSQLTCWGTSQEIYKTPANIGNVTMVSSGASHICAGDSTKLQCWGENYRGALVVPKELTNFTQVTTGFSHACAVANDQVTCWGGEGLVKNVNPLNKMISPKSICAGTTFSCGITASGKVECWGEKIELTDKSGKKDLSNEVLKVPTDINDAVEISCGSDHGCAITNGKIKCWGSTAIAPPTNIKNPRMLTSGWNHSCALGDNGLNCWGTMIGMEMPQYSLTK